MVADNTVLCGHCYWCRRDKPLYCENFYSLGCTGPGGFAEYVAAKAEKAFAWNKLEPAQGTMVEPTACAVHGLDMIDVQPGDRILLFGTGPTANTVTGRSDFMIVSTIAPTPSVWTFPG